MPWLLLFCSGLEDVAVVTGKPWVVWFGGIVALLFLYYFEHYTSLSFVTKAAMPPIAVDAGMIPSGVLAIFDVCRHRTRRRLATLVVDKSLLHLKPCTE